MEALGVRLGSVRRRIDLTAAPPASAVRAALTLRRRLRRAANALVPDEILAYEEANAFFRTRVLGALVELGLVDALGGARRSADDLAAELGLDADTVHRLLRAAAAYDFVSLDGSGRFALTRVGRAVRRERSPSMAAWVRYVNSDAVQAAWAALPSSVRDGQPSFPAVHGRSTWEHFAAHPEEGSTFAEAMLELSRLTLAWIERGYPWPERGVVCDVAGGSGPVLAAILVRRPAVRGILVEAPEILASADEHLRAEGVRHRVELVEGDLFGRIDAVADVYLVKDILHDYDDERCRSLLATIAAAMPVGARLVVVETALERSDPDPIAAPLDLHMLTQCDGGRQRSIAEIGALLRGAGLRVGTARQTGGPALVEAIR